MRVSFTVKVSVRVIQVARNYVDVGRGRCRPQCNYIGKLKWPILSCNCEETQPRR